MDAFTQYHGPSTDNTHEFLFAKYGDGHSELIVRPLFAGQPDTAAQWSPPLCHFDITAGAR